MQVRTGVKGVSRGIQNHAEAIVVRTGVKGGGMNNHAQAIVVGR
jgi:hypothetical protein